MVNSPRSSVFSFLKFNAWITLGILVDLAVIIGIWFSLPDPTLLLQGTTLDRVNSEGKVFKFVAGPKNKNYVYLETIPKVLPAAILALEDGKFFMHRGFDFDQILNAIRSTWMNGSRLRGASTLSQQLAKNLYLNPSRTFRRKLIEAFVTIKIETYLSKRKILELYLNSIDWGRGLLGIQEAAKHYFKKSASQLELKEAIFLAAIIPNPARFGHLPTESSLPKRFVRVQMMRAIESLYQSRMISLGEYQRAMRQPFDLSGMEENFPEVPLDQLPSELRPPADLFDSEEEPMNEEDLDELEEKPAPEVVPEPSASPSERPLIKMGWP